MENIKRIGLKYWKGGDLRDSTISNHQRVTRRTRQELSHYISSYATCGDKLKIKAKLWGVLSGLLNSPTYKKTITCKGSDDNQLCEAPGCTVFRLGLTCSG